MNLAEIRKKAQQAESTEPQPAASWPIPAAPEPVQAPVTPEPPQAAVAQEPPRDVPAAQLPEPQRAARAPEPAAPLAPPYQAPPSCWEPEPAGAAFPADLEFYEEQDVFDPAALILKGRQSASFEEVAQEEQVEAASVELLCFRVASEEYAISIMDIKEIIKPREVTEVPRMPAFVRGILSLRGNIIPIFDMRVRLGLSAAAAAERGRVVVVKRQGGFCGVLVDEVVQVVRIAQSGIEPPPVLLEGIDRDFVQGIGRVGGRMLILLDMEKVLDVGLL